MSRWGRAQADQAPAESGRRKQERRAVSRGSPAGTPPTCGRRRAAAAARLAPSLAAGLGARLPAQGGLAGSAAHLPTGVAGANTSTRSAGGGASLQELAVV